MRPDIMSLLNTLKETLQRTIDLMREKYRIAACAPLPSGGKLWWKRTYPNKGPSEWSLIYQSEEDVQESKPGMDVAMCSIDSMCEACEALPALIAMLDEYNGSLSHRIVAATAVVVDVLDDLRGHKYE